MEELRYSNDPPTSRDRNYVLLFKFKGYGQWREASGCLSAGCTGFKQGDNSEGENIFIFYLHRTLERLHLQSPVWCPFTTEEISEHLNDINRVIKYPLSWNIEEKENFYKLTVKMDNRYNSKQVLYILTRIRYLYEVPFCLVLKDALKLKESFPEESLEQRFLRVSNIIPENIDPGARFLDGSRVFFNYWRAIPNHKDPTSRSIWKGEESLRQTINRLSTFGMDRLNYVFKMESNPEWTQLPFTDSMLDLGFWTEGFELRKPYYEEKEKPSSFKLSREQIKYFKEIRFFENTFTSDLESYEKYKKLFLEELAELKNE